VQYAHARICSLLKTLADEGFSARADADITLADSAQERELIKALSRFPEEIKTAARDYDPSYINRYLVELSGAFHRFYNACRIKGEAADVTAVRLALAEATRRVLANGLGILGVTAPEKM
ncbi:MAG: arginine--tRNA ligase, partial [Oscillospiraceae bacterium]|nr:arginine--tRNA ligase [Oscillospiraceae bacterium]